MRRPNLRNTHLELRRSARAPALLAPVSPDLTLAQLHYGNVAMRSHCAAAEGRTDKLRNTPVWLPSIDELRQLRWRRSRSQNCRELRSTRRTHCICNARISGLAKYGVRRNRNQLAETNARILIEALDANSPLRRALLGCGQPTEWQYSAPCRKIACAACRAKYAARQVAQAQERFGHLSNQDMGLLTIVMGTTGAVTGIEEIAQTGRHRLRNLVEVLRRRSPRWRTLEILGHFEIDAVAPEDLDKLPPKRAELLAAFGPPEWTRRGQPLWVVTIHAVVSFGGASLAEFDAALREAWPLPHQTDLRPFNPNQPFEKNLACTVRYPLKHACVSTFWHQDSDDGDGRARLIDEPWPGSWRAKFYEYLNRWSRGYQSLHISIGQRGVKRTRHTLREEEASTSSAERRDEDYLPVLVYTEDHLTLSHLYELWRETPPWRRVAQRTRDPPA